MARFLTPAKIGLLVLIELYLEGAASSRSIVPILSFITSHLLVTTSAHRGALLGGRVSGRRRNESTLTIEHFRDFLSSCASSRIPGRTLWDTFVDRLWNIDSLDKLHAFFDSRSRLLARSGLEAQGAAIHGAAFGEDDVCLSRASPLGAFVRKSQLEFIRLKFHDAVNLWMNLIVYRQSSRADWLKRNPAADRGYDAVLDSIVQSRGGSTIASIAYSGRNVPSKSEPGFVSTDDIERLLEFQIEQMQKLGTRVPEDVQSQFQHLASSNVLMPSLTHYVNFLDAWRAGDYSTSFDSLHRFFDYTMQNRDRLFYQYALLNLAVLQADFGCYEEAVAAMQETVTTARENKDMGCLNFSLSWLYHFGKAHPNVITKHDKTNMLGVEREGLAFLRVKAKESNMLGLWSSSLLSEAKLGLCSGESVATAFENVLRSSQLSVARNMMSNIGAQMMLQSSIWSRLGNSRLASSHCEVFLRCHSWKAPFDDVLKFTCRTAYLMYQNGDFEEAMSHLEGLDKNSLRSLRSNQYWSRFRGILHLKHDLHRSRLHSADLLLQQLLCNRGGDSDLTFEINLLNIDAMVRREDFSNALRLVEELASELKDQGDDMFFRTRLLLLKALLFEKIGRPQRGFSIAVRAASIAWRARLLPLLWHAMGAVATILSSLREFDAAGDILHSVLPRAFECGDSALMGQLFLWQTDAFIGMAGKAGTNIGKKREYLTKALETADRSFEEWTSVEDVNGMVEMTAKKAVILRVLGERQLSNDYAAKSEELRRTIWLEQ